MTERKRKPKANNPRTEVFAMRLDPKLKYLAEIAARKQRRSLANFMEWAIELGLKQTDLEIRTDEIVTVWDRSSYLWDIDEAERLAKLAFNAPDLMSYDDQILWKIICENGYFWTGRHDSNGDWRWSTHESSLIHERLRDTWLELKKVASGEIDRDTLPVVAKKKPAIDDDIPF